MSSAPVAQAPDISTIVRAGCSVSPGAVAPAVKVTGPITGGTYNAAFLEMPVTLAASASYQEYEYFLEGSAQSYVPQGTWGADGMWQAVPAPSKAAPYKTRVVVRRPIDGSKFNGTVIVEWFNVSATFDEDPDFSQAYDELLRGGYAYVGVSAQKVGVDGIGSGITLSSGQVLGGLKLFDPARYGTLNHPGDDYSFDIFNQVAELIRQPANMDVLGGLCPSRIIATGESQSAGALSTYVNAVHPLTHVYDGFFIHSRGALALALQAGTDAPASKIRADVDVPTFIFQTETDLFTLGFYALRQPDLGNIRTWEVTGTSHADQRFFTYGFWSGLQYLQAADLVADIENLCGNINTGPQTYVERKAIRALTEWVTSGTPPASGAPLQVNTDWFGSTSFAHDSYGNVLGGVRTPAVDVPIAVVTGEQNNCGIFGQTIPFSDATLRTLYPNNEAYVRKVRSSAQAAVGAGFLLPEDADELVHRASLAAIPPP